MRRFWVLISAILLIGPLAPAVAAELAGVQLDEASSAGEQQLVLNGLGIRKKAFIKVYVGGLYLPAKQKDPQQILSADTARQMALVFVRKVDKDALCSGWKEGLANNSPEASVEVKAQFEQLCSFLADVSSDDRLRFTYVPGAGTEIEVKGNVKGTIPGKPFADAILACWLGPQPPNAEFKASLLGG